MLDGASEVVWLVVCTCLATVAAIFPLLLQGGGTGKFFSVVSKVVIGALIFSIDECSAVLPVSPPRLWRPFVVGSIYGIGMSSIMTLFLVSVLYFLVVRSEE